MKINIWIKKEDAISGNITTHNTHPVMGVGYEDYVQVSITQDEFARLEDEKHDRWLVDQYNRNRMAEDQIENVNQISDHEESGRSHVNYIYERNPDTNETTRRISGEYDNKEKI
jgi:hypothetical protein